MSVAPWSKLTIWKFSAPSKQDHLTAKPINKLNISKRKLTFCSQNNKGNAGKTKETICKSRKFSVIFFVISELNQ